MAASAESGSIAHRHLGSRQKDFPNLIVPEANAQEAAMVSGVYVYPVKSLLDVVHSSTPAMAPPRHCG